jgi:hypothetical protein
MDRAMNSNLRSYLRGLRPRRRWARFGLRSLLALVLIAALPCAWFRAELDELAAEHEVIVQLEEAGAHVMTIEAQPQWFWRLVPEWLAPHRLRAIDVQHWATEQNIRETVKPAGPREVALVARLSRLKGVVFAHSPNITDEDLRAFSAMRDLEAFVLINCPRITEHGLENLSRAYGLLALSLNSTSAGDGCMQVITRLRRLQSLDLYGTNVTDASAAEIARLTELRQLVLPREVTSKGLRDLMALNRLDGLDVWLHPGKDVEALGCVRLLPLLEYLTLHGDGLSDAGLRIALELPRLKQLHIYGGKLTSDGLRALLRAPSAIALQVDMEAVLADGLPGDLRPFVGDPREPPRWAQKALDDDPDAETEQALRRAPRRPAHRIRQGNRQ